MYENGLNIEDKNGIKYLTGSKRDIEGIVIVPEGVSHIKDSAFANRIGITEVILPDGLRTIGNLAFQNCSSLKHIRIPDSVTDIGHKAFSRCYQLEEIVSCNMTDPFPFSCYCFYDNIRRNGQEPSNRRLIYEDKDFTIPVAFPKVRLNTAYKPYWKEALTLGFITHPELYSAYDLDKKSKVYRGVSCYEEDMPYAKYAMTNKKKLLAYVFEHDRPDMLRFYVAFGKFKKKAIQESFLNPAKKVKATKCVKFITKWIDNKLDLEPIVPRKAIIKDLPGNTSSEEALEEWAYTIDYRPEPIVRLTGYKSDERGLNIVIPNYIDDVPVGILDKCVFMYYIFDDIGYKKMDYSNYADVISISFGSNIKKIEQIFRDDILLIVPKNSYAHKYAKKNKCNYVFDDEISKDISYLVEDDIIDYFTNPKTNYEKSSTIKTDFKEKVNSAYRLLTIIKREYKRQPFDRLISKYIKKEECPGFDYTPLFDCIDDFDNEDVIASLYYCVEMFAGFDRNKYKELAKDGTIGKLLLHLKELPLELDG